MTQWIGDPKFKAIPLPKTGDRSDFNLNVDTPNGNSFQVPLTISGTVSAIWDKDPNEAAVGLGAAIFQKVGTAKIPSGEHYWFDSYNSGQSYTDTIKKIANEDISHFIKVTSVEADYARYFGNLLAKKIEALDKHFTEKFNMPFFVNLDLIQEESRIPADLNVEPQDHANYIYRVCILSVLIDHIGMPKIPIKGGRMERSLEALKRWVSEKYDASFSDDITKTFSMIKKLRKQYPIHDHFVSIAGVLEDKKAVVEAQQYFGITDTNKHSENFIKIREKFAQTLDRFIAL